MTSLMEYMAHGPPFPLHRTQTAPMNPSGGGGVFAGAGDAASSRAQSAQISGAGGQQPSLVHSQAHTSSNYSIQSRSDGSSRSSDTTQGTAASTLFPPPLPNNASTIGDVTATDNVMNSVADASSSLFQICVTLRQRLMGVPGFRETLEEEELDADDDTDPVTLLWRTFRRGEPLMLLYNTLRPAQPLTLAPSMRADKRGKAGTFKFLQACIVDLKFPQEECFIITDLYGDDTTGFVKVAKVVNRVLDILVQRGIVDDIRPTASDFEQAEKGMKKSQRQHIISELVTTERTYVQHLELLQAFKLLVEEKGVIPGDAVHDIFLNLNSLLDFQRRFLIRVEQTNHMPEHEQNWGRLFIMYCDAFIVYEPYIANQRKCEKTVVAHFDKLASAASTASIEMRQMVESSTNLYGFLMKPFQRLSKYPLLLEDLYKKGDLDDGRKADLLLGKEAATNVLSRTNHAVDREEKAEAVEELKLRVEDWKGHRVEGFGELLLYGTFTVLKSENIGAGKDGERQYHVYLFETILLCCKDFDLSKPKNKLSNKQLVDKRGKPKLQLKGRIFMQNVTDLISLGKPGSYTCQIFWKGDPSIENFIIRFTTEDMMKKWATQVEAQRRKYRDKSARGSEGNRSLGTSTTEFEFMRNQPAMQNPYANKWQQENDDDTGEDEDERDEVDTLVETGLPMRDFEQTSRNGSFSSLRSRGDSIGAQRQPPPRFAAGVMQAGNGNGPNLSLRTRELPGGTPGDFPPDSYFSPVEGSPSTLASSRTSAGSALSYNFPAPTPNGYYPPPPPTDASGAYTQNNSRFTAPALARQREPSTSSATPPPQAQPGRGPPPRPGMHSSVMQWHRNRSASSPDIHNQPRGPQQGEPQPPMPALYEHQPPAHLIPRSSTGSPSSLMLGGGPPQQQQRVSPQQQGRAPSRGQVLPPPPQMAYQQSSRTTTPTPGAQPHPITMPSPAPQAPPLDVPGPTQLKVKVHCPAASQTLTLVVPLNISYQSLKDRIDAKLQRSTNLTLSAGVAGKEVVKLKFLDEEDFVSIQSDEDVLTAFETCGVGAFGAVGGGGGNAGMVEVELFCQR